MAKNESFNRQTYDEMARHLGEQLEAIDRQEKTVKEMTDDLRSAQTHLLNLQLGAARMSRQLEQYLVADPTEKGKPAQDEKRP